MEVDLPRERHGLPRLGAVCAADQPDGVGQHGTHAGVTTGDQEVGRSGETHEVILGYTKLPHGTGDGVDLSNAGMRADEQAPVEIHRGMDVIERRR